MVNRRVANQTEKPEETKAAEKHRRTPNQTATPTTVEVEFTYP
jgi:hypothetical protein